MDNKKILESARDKLREQQPVENVAGQDKSLLGDVLGMVAGVAGANSGGKPNLLSLLGQIQNLAGSAGSSTNRPDAANLLGQIQNLVNLAGMVGGNSGGNQGGSNLISQIQSLANLVGGNSGGKPDVSNLINQVQNLSNIAGSQSTQSARESESHGKVSGRKPDGRVASAARLVADQLRERKRN